MRAHVWHTCAFLCYDYVIMGNLLSQLFLRGVRVLGENQRTLINPQPSQQVTKLICSSKVHPAVKVPCPGLIPIPPCPGLVPTLNCLRLVPIPLCPRLVSIPNCLRLVPILKMVVVH